jgi:hypothetical protein
MWMHIQLPSMYDTTAFAKSLEVYPRGHYCSAWTPQELLFILPTLFFYLDRGKKKSSQALADVLGEEESYKKTPQAAKFLFYCVYHKITTRSTAK